MAASKKKITGYIKLQLPAGKANPAPPVGPALGQHGVNIMGFCKDFNAKSAKLGDTVVPVIITVYARSFVHVRDEVGAGEHPAQEGGGSGDERQARFRLARAEPQEGRQGHEGAGARDRQYQARRIMNAHTAEAAARSIAGTARSMGIEVTD